RSTADTAVSHSESAGAAVGSGRGWGVCWGWSWRGGRGGGAGWGGGGGGGGGGWGGGVSGELRCAVGVPNVGSFGDPLLLVELAVAAEEHGWDGFFVWDHLLYHDQRWDVADP